DGRLREPPAPPEGERDAARRGCQRRAPRAHRRGPLLRRARREGRHLDARAAGHPAAPAARDRRPHAGLAGRRPVHGDGRAVRARAEPVRGARPPADRGDPRGVPRRRRDDRLLRARAAGLRRRVRTAVLATNLALGLGALAWVLHRHGAAAVALLERTPDGMLLALFALAVLAAFAAYSLRWRILLAALGV